MVGELDSPTVFWGMNRVGAHSRKEGILNECTDRSEKATGGQAYGAESC